MDDLYFPRLEPKDVRKPIAHNREYAKAKAGPIIPKFFLENTKGNEGILRAMEVLDEYVPEDLHLAYGNYLYINLPEPKVKTGLRIKMGKKSRKYGVYCHIHEENERFYIGNLPRYMGEILTALKESKLWTKKHLSKQLRMKFTHLSKDSAGVGFLTRPWMPWWMHQKREMYRFSVAGVTFEGRQEVLKKISENPENYSIDIARENGNIYDDNAIMVIACSGYDGEINHIGYVPKKDAKALARYLDNNSPYDVRMVACDKFESQDGPEIYYMKLQMEVLLASHYNKWVPWTSFDIDEWRKGGDMKLSKYVGSLKPKKKHTGSLWPDDLLDGAWS